MTVAIELYRKNACDIEVSGVQTTEQAMLQEQIACLYVKKNHISALGFAGQARLLYREIFALEDRVRFVQGTHPGNFYPELTLEECRIWWQFLPLSYTFEPAKEAGFECNYYAFDYIPDEVLQELELCRSLNLFTCYMIRTPEDPRLRDPLCLGQFFDYTQNDWRRFMIGRWGESLMPFEDIKQQVQPSPLVQHAKTLSQKLQLWFLRG